MKAIVIWPKKGPQLHHVKGYDDVRAIVGGDLQALPFRVGATAYIDENAKVRSDKPPVHNVLATSLCALIGQGLLPDDYIAGPMVILGDFDADGIPDGEWHDVPDDVIVAATEHWLSGL